MVSQILELYFFVLFLISLKIQIPPPMSRGSIFTQVIYCVFER